MKIKSPIYFITGVSGAGKSTMIPLLKKRLDKVLFDIHDFDERGVPVGVNAKWRHNATKYWLKLGYDNARKGITTIISGLTLPSEVMRFLDKRRAINIRICFLNHTNQHIKKRLAVRFKNKGKVSNLKKVLNISPQIFIQNNLKFAVKMRKDAKQNNAYFINTTHDTPLETADKIIRWINKNSFRLALLTLLIVCVNI